MRLSKVHVTEFQSVRDSTEFEVGDITCLVGKNEAGKTAILQAIYRLNPIEDSAGEFSVTDDYPRWDVEDYRHAVESGDRDHATVVRATFSLDAEDTRRLQEKLGPDVIVDREFALTKGYENERHFHFRVNESAALKFVLSQSENLPSEDAARLAACSGVGQMLTVLSESEQTEAIAKLTATLSPMKQGVAHFAYNELLRPKLPKFLYFDEYYQMRGRDSIQKLKQRLEQGVLIPSDHPLLGLINLARLDLDELLAPTRTRELKNRLEGAGNHLTKNVVKYWSQNKHLHMRFDVREARPEDPEGMRNGPNIWGEVYDDKHMVTTELGTRSRGFVWFFSFLAWYSDLKRQNQRLILLLDEPGLTLHGKAQADLLRYFEEEVKGLHQLIYTTHSPFMVDPENFDRVRIVRDRGIDSNEELPPEQEGTKVFTDILDADEDSLFPLQGALGYEIHQTLFIGPNSLVVEGASDLLYIRAMSALLEEVGKKGLSEKWTITPVGGSDKVPTFVALVGAQRGLNIATLIDYQKKDAQTIENLFKRKLLKKKHVLTFADFTQTKEADIEDMFEQEVYLALVNAEYGAALAKPIAASDLDQKHPRVLVRLERYFDSHPLKGGLEFSHYRPSRYFSENLGALKKRVSDETLGRFEAAFKAVNALLKKGD